MRHHNKNRKFGRGEGQRRALLRSLVKNLIIKGKIKTTLAKAKELRKHVEPIVTLGKVDSVARRRMVESKLASSGNEVKILFKNIAPKYIERKGGYTRIIKLAPRKSDSAEMAYIEFV